MNALAAAWFFGGLSVTFLVLLLIALGGNSELAEENRRLRRALIRTAHPSTRRTNR